MPKFGGLIEDSQKTKLDYFPLVMWYTPQIYIDAAREVMGDIDLDPATDDRVQERIKARRYFTVHTNGLDKPWHGRVWLNSPYGPPLELFAKKAVAEYQAGNTTELIFGTHTDESYSDWFQGLGEISDAVCFHRGTIEWVGDHTGWVDGKAVHLDDVGIKFDANYTVHGSVFFYIGPNADKFKEVFSKWGFVK